jgi:hypothetical protein
MMGTVVCCALSIIFACLSIAYAAFLSALLAFMLSVEATEQYDNYREWHALDKKYGEGTTTFTGPTTAYVVCKAREGDNCEHHKCKYAVVHIDEPNGTLSFTCGRKEDDNAST